MSDDVSFSLSEAVVIAVIATAGTILTALIAFFGGRGSVQAQLQGQLNDTMELVVKNLEKRLEDSDTLIRDMRVEIRSLQAYNIALARILRENNIPVPQPQTVAPVFVLDSLPPSALDKPHA